MLNTLDKLRFEYTQLPFANSIRRDVAERLGEGNRPRVAFVKQDVQDDLYCCARGSTPTEIVSSTLMRSGPVALFTRLNAEFLIVRTETDPECQAWQEKSTELGWADLANLTRLRKNVPGRNHGQSQFATTCDEIDWSTFDVVISLDVSVPSRITRRFQNTLWCYYIREPKTSSYARSLTSPLPGQDIFLNQCFGIQMTPARQRHVLDFPYYFQYFGCLHEILSSKSESDTGKSTVFLEHHTPEWMTTEQLQQLAVIGPVDSTCRSPAGDALFAHYNQKCQRSPVEIYSALTNAKYFVACPRIRHVWGNAAVEAIVAGALVIGDPDHHTHNAWFSRRTSTTTFDDLIRAIDYFETHPAAYRVELQRQRSIVDYLCYWRPLRSLLRVHAGKSP